MQWRPYVTRNLKILTIWLFREKARQPLTQRMARGKKTPDKISKDMSGPAGGLACPTADSTEGYSKIPQIKTRQFTAQKVQKHQMALLIPLPLIPRDMEAQLPAV